MMLPSLHHCEHGIILVMPIVGYVSKLSLGFVTQDFMLSIIVVIIRA